MPGEQSRRTVCPVCFSMFPDEGQTNCPACGAQLGETQSPTDDDDTDLAYWPPTEPEPPAAREVIPPPREATVAFPAEAPATQWHRDWRTIALGALVVALLVALIVTNMDGTPEEPVPAVATTPPVPTISSTATEGVPFGEGPEGFQQQSTFPP